METFFLEGLVRKIFTGMGCSLKGVLATICIPMSAMAWDGLQGYDVIPLTAGGHNYDFRVYLKGVDSMCTGGATVNWAYINTDAGNYKAVVAAVMTAHAAGKRIILYTNRSSTTSNCEMGYLQVTDPQ